MSTRAVIAVPDGDAWRGRFVEQHGYPLWTAAAIWKLVDRHGLELVGRVLVTGEHRFWSYLDPDSERRPQRDPLCIRVLGFGVAQIPLDPTMGELLWCRPRSTWGAEWVYVLADDGLWIGNDADLPVPAGRWDQPEPDWSDTAVRASW